MDRFLSDERKHISRGLILIFLKIAFMDYIRNSKNRKLKTQILSFFSRIQFGTYRFGFSGKALMIIDVALLISLFFPWLHFGV